MTNIPETVDGATIVIVGASSGFGRGAAVKLGSMGANVVVAARRTNLLNEVVEEIESDGGDALAVTADVSNRDEVKDIAMKAKDEFGAIDVWVNNVGVGALGYFWDIPLDVHDRVVDVNLKGLITGAHVAINHFLEKNGGTLVNVGSIDSEVPLALQNTYAATKSAVLSLSKSINEELRLSGNDEKIKVATIMPWAVDTPWWEHAANYTGHAPRMAAMDDPEIVVDKIIEACTDPQEKMPVGAKAKASNISHQIMPDLTEKMSATIANRESEKGSVRANSTGTLFEPMQDGAGMHGGVEERMEEEDQN